MLMNHKGEIFSSCEKAKTQPYNMDLERLRDCEQAIIDKVLDDCPLDILRRGYELPSGKLHGVIKNGENITMLYVCPVINAYTPTDGQLIHSLTMAQELPAKAKLNEIVYIVINLSNGEIEQVNQEFTPPYELLTEPVKQGEHCKKCIFWGQCNE